MFKQIINIVVIKSIGDLCPSIERIKGKHFRGEELRLRNLFIKKVLKYKKAKQVDLLKFLSISYHLVSKEGIEL